jgi:hypothetical protein
MKLHAITVPDDPSGLARWLEQHLLGPDLGALVAELTAIHGPVGTTPTLEEVLGTPASVRERGLAVLPPDRLRRLLAHPQLLLQLQEWLLTSESTYWEKALADTAPLEDLVQRGRQVVVQRRSESAPLRLHRAEPHAEQPRQAWYRQSWFASLATAAAVLLAVAGYQHFVTKPVDVPVQTAWGWNRPEMIRDDVRANAYLDRLAKGAGEWFDERPETAPDLAQRLGELRTGCAQLILAAHRPLSAADRPWLINRCRAWAAQLDKQLTALESGQSPKEVRDQTDTTIREIMDELQKRAKMASQT